ncbi:MAG: EAL domain-containing protein [Abditibacteriota bacterium]|nr:EAL domain-containing protein [Abditibacteriota bacterium]
MEDEAVNLKILSRYLEDKYAVIPAATGNAAMEIIRSERQTLSLVLLDLNLPDLHGMDILRRLNADPEYARLPVIVMTSDSEAELQCLTLGAIDFIPKPYPKKEIVLARIRRIVELSEDRDLLRWTERDHLTGLYNKDFFYRYAAMLDDYHKDLKTDVLVLDVHRFRIINDRFGKACGDRVLQRIAEQALDLVRNAGGIVCRNEADRFFIYCPHRSDHASVLEKLSAGVNGADEDGIRVHLRMGVYSEADKSLDIERRFDRAKMAAESVKGSITNAVGIYDHSMYEAEHLAQRLIGDFPAAVREKQFMAYFQPKFNVAGDRPELCSAEALARWKHPDMGLISPGLFIPVFEQNGLVQALDHFIWKEAAAEVRRLRDALGVRLPVSVNVSRIDLEDPALIGRLTDILGENGLEPGDLILEITESVYSEDPEQIVKAAASLRRLGFCFEMDDFGSGYSSLSMLSSLPIDVLKLDMQFVRTSFANPRAACLLEAMIKMADSLGVPCIAEGVETREQAEALKKMGCAIIQGYYFSRPLPAEEYRLFAAEHIDGRHKL